MPANIKIMSLEERKTESKNIMTKFADKIPVIINKHRSSKMIIGETKKDKYLVPKIMKLSNLSSIIRKNLALSSSESLILYNEKDVLMNSNDDIIKIYETSKNIDGFLYIYYTEEATFG